VTRVSAAYSQETVAYEPRELSRAHSEWVKQASLKMPQFLDKCTELSESREQIRFVTMRTYRFVSYEKDNTCTHPEDIVSPLKTFLSLVITLRPTIPY